MSSVMKMLTQGGKSRRRGKGRGRGKSGRRYQNQNDQNENQNQNQFQFQGGQATDEYVAKVVGGNEQVGTAGPTSGAIVLKAQDGGSLSLTPASFGAAPVSAPVAQKGGKKGHYGKKGKKGGNLLGQIAVPAVLLYANQAFGKRRSTMSKRSSRKFRGSRRFRR